MPATFMKRCLTQSRSRLMQLPPELLLMILKLCLKPVKPLHPLYGPGDGDAYLPRDWENYVAPTNGGGWCGSPPPTTYPPRLQKTEAEKREARVKFTAQLNLSAQILRCCQRLYIEARPMLYKDTELTIFCDRKYISILETKLEKTRLQDNSCWPAAYLTINDSKESKDQMSNILPIIDNFQKINVIIEQSSQVPRNNPFQYPPYTNLATTAIGIRHLLYGKDVRVRAYLAIPDSDLWQPGGYSSGFEIGTTYDYNALQVLNYWRCRSLTFYDTDIDEDIKTPIIETVTSDKLIYDLINPYEQFQKEIDDECRENLDCQLIRDAMKDLAGAAYAADTDVYLKGRDEVAKMAEEMGRKDIAKLLKQKKGLWPADPAKKRRLKRRYYQISTI